MVPATIQWGSPPEIKLTEATVPGIYAITTVSGMTDDKYLDQILIPDIRQNVCQGWACYPGQRYGLSGTVDNYIQANTVFAETIKVTKLVKGDSITI